MNHQELLKGFEQRFGGGPSTSYFSPGRVNLIGEYTDFNGGYVLPAAVDLGTYYVARANGSKTINVYSDGPDETRSISLSATSEAQAQERWDDYVVGILREFADLGLTVEGMDIFVTSNLPQNSGLSSSASFTVGLAYLFNDAWGCGLDRLDLVKAAKRVENNFVGVQCGIMDQFAVAMGKADHCIYLHCQSLDFELVPANMHGHEIVIADSRVPRRLASSAYNDRRNECDTALETLRAGRDLDYLVAASLDEVESSAALRAQPLPYKRARHVVSENERVQDSVRALRDGDLQRFGELMQASHVSLRDDFEVSCRELDILVDAAMRAPGVLGSRMTGAGFGGCTVSLVAEGAVPDFISSVGREYAAATPYEARIFRARCGDGVGRLDFQDK